MSVFSTTSEGVLHTWAPASRKARHLESVRFHTTTVCPELIRFFTIPEPIRPSPRKPNRSALGWMFFDRSVCDTCVMSISGWSGGGSGDGRFSSAFWTLRRDTLAAAWYDDDATLLESANETRMPESESPPPELLLFRWLLARGVDEMRGRFAFVADVGGDESAASLAAVPVESRAAARFTADWFDRGTTTFVTEAVFGSSFCFRPGVAFFGVANAAAALLLLMFAADTSFSVTVDASSSLLRNLSNSAFGSGSPFDSNSSLNCSGFLMYASMAATASRSPVVFRLFVKLSLNSRYGLMCVFSIQALGNWRERVGMIN